MAILVISSVSLGTVKSSTRMASLLCSAIERWLADIPHPQPRFCADHSLDKLEIERPAKRRKVDSQSIHLPSPARSVTSSIQDREHLVGRPTASGMAPETPRKRKAVNDSIGDDETPRPAKAPSTASSVFEDASSLSSQSNQSQRSGRSSPVRAFPIRGIDNHFLRSRTMNPNQPEMPAALLVLLGELQDIVAAHSFIPSFLKPEIDARLETDQSLRWLRPYAYAPPNDSDVEAGHPSIAPSLLSTIDMIVDQASTCQTSGYDETGWNHLVHTPLLHAVCKTKWWSDNFLVDFCPCMNAPVIAQLHNFPIPSTKVDYALCIFPTRDTDTAVSEATERLKDSVVEGSVNHTAFDPLRSWPLCVSIETKRYGGDLKKADVQMGAWQAAQWTLLQSQAGDGIEALPFLPGIIVQGHEWKFVATTRTGQETLLWASFPFGSTMTSLGVLQIMAALRLLRRWSAAVFWPWYKAHVLKLSALPCR